MNAYVYNADIYCESCANAIKADIRDNYPNDVPEDPDDEHTFDSGDWPKGPYGDGGGEADHPQHCGECGEFLENPLTDDGVEYVRDALSHMPASRLPEWREFYSLSQLQVDYPNRFDYVKVD